MSLAALKVVIDIHWNKRTRTEKRSFLSKEVIIGPPPVEIYIEMTNFSSGATTRHLLLEDLPEQIRMMYYEISEPYDYALDHEKLEQAKKKVIRFLSELSDQGWKVRNASDKIIAFLDEIKRPMSKFVIDEKTTGSITISTIDEP